MKQNNIQKVSGIYKIQNIKNGRVYIGSSHSLKDRKRTHYSQLANDKHGNKFLQRDYNKCGQENFIFEIIEYAPIENLLSIEQKYIDTYFDNQKKCYNIAPIAKSILGVKRSDKMKKYLSSLYKNKTWKELYGERKSKEMREKLSKAMKQRDNVPRYGSDNSFYGRQHTKETKLAISKANKNKLIGEKNPMYGRKGKLHPFYGRKGKLHHSSKRVIQINIETNQQIQAYDSIREAQRLTGICNTVISRCCLGKQKTAGGFKWSFLSEQKR